MVTGRAVSEDQLLSRLVEVAVLRLFNLSEDVVSGMKFGAESSMDPNLYSNK